jgi:cation diffusion facilitator family transporter
VSSAVEKERSVFLSLIVDFVLFIPDIVAAVMANSITMYADVLKCANEIFATFLAWITLRKISKGKAVEYDYGLGKFENLTGVGVAVFMLISLVVVAVTAVDRIRNPVAMHAGGAGLAIFMMTAGVCVNSWLWLKNYRIARKEHSPIMESQWRLFRTKAISDAIVLLALGVSVVFNQYSWAHYVDPIASFLVAGFIGFSIYSILSDSLYDLLDKAIDESLQLIIVKHLAVFMDEYHDIHGVRSRRAGNRIFIEIFLEFDGERKMSHVQEVINKMKQAMETAIKGSFVSIVPSSSKIS